MSANIHHGDCLEYMRAMPDKSIDVAITDPPYEAEAHTKWRRIVSRKAIDAGTIREAPISFDAIDDATREECGRQLVRVSKRWIAIFCQVEAAHKWAASIVAGGGRYIRTGVWIKPDAQPQFTGDRPGCGYESIVFGYAAPSGRMAWNGGGRVAVFEAVKATPEFRKSGNPHPTTKPVPLMLELVSLFSNLGETVFDPFMGSGTTGIAAARLGRGFVGCEKDANYHAIATDRINAEIAQTNLSAMRAGQVPLFGVAK